MQNWRNNSFFKLTRAGFCQQVIKLQRKLGRIYVPILVLLLRLSLWQVTDPAKQRNVSKPIRFMQYQRSHDTCTLAAQLSRPKLIKYNLM